MPILKYANWHKLQLAYREVYLSLCLENPHQCDMLPSTKTVQLGYGALREVEDWRLSETALIRVLSRIASHKPDAVRELRRRSNARFRIETEIGAILFDFCEQAKLPITQQKTIENYRFDFCIAERLLIEVDEEHHQLAAEGSKTAKIDEQKDHIAARYGYKLLRIPIPIDNIAKFCGMVTWLLLE